jgi:tetratricopeptide (TPR) repeat protein
MDNSTHGMPELLVRYMDGELSDSERAELEKKLAADASLQSELESLQLSREAIRRFGLQQQVSSIHHEMMSEMKAPVRKLSTARRIIRYSMGAAAAILLIVIGIMGYTYYRLSPERVFNENYQPYELATLRGDDSLDKAENEYRKGNYQQVINISNENANPQYQFLAAMSYLQLNKYPEAISQFKSLLNENRLIGVQKDQAEYYLALAYIRNQDYDLSLEILESMRNNPSHTYHEKATNKLLRQLKLLKWK